MSREHNLLPTFLYGHTFSANTYQTKLPNLPAQMEITVILDGTLFLEKDGKQFTAQKQDIICNDYQTPLFLDTSQSHSHMTVCFALENGFLPMSPPLITRNLKVSTTCQFLINKIIRNHFLPAKTNLIQSGLILQLLGELESFHSTQPLIGSPSEHRYVEKAKRFIFDHISEPIVQNDIAKYLNISPQYLCTIFKKIEGRSLIRHVNEIKLTSIKELMNAKQLTLTQASAQFGFTDPNYISKLYKKYYNESITKQIKT